MSTERLQTTHMLMLLLHMKRWRFLWAIAVLFAAIANHFAFPIIDSWMGTTGQTYVDSGAHEFASNGIILAEKKKASEQLDYLLDMLKMQKVETDSLLEDCSGPAECEAKMFRVLFGRINTNRFSNYVAYSSNGSGSPSIQCHMAHGGELNCPYLGNLAAVSQHKAEGKEHFSYKRVVFFRLTSSKEGKKVNAQRGRNTMCAKHDNFEAVYSHTAMLHCMLLAGAVSFYFLVSTQACISSLKRDGFLQLMFQKGMSVKSYWLAVGGISLAEVLVISIVFVLSLALQCVGFFSPAHMMAVFVLTLFLLLSLTTAATLLTVTLGNYFYVGLLTGLVAITTMAMILLNRLVINAVGWLKFVTLFVWPLGHFAEFVQGAMLAEIRNQSLGAYNIAILLVNLLLPIALVLGVLLLDFTHSAGNGFLLPSDFFRRSEFWNAPKQETENEEKDPLYGLEPEPCPNVEVVTEDLRPLVRMSHLSKTFESRASCCDQRTSFTAIRDMSALIYENHITAIIGHNGAGKTTLINLLTGVEVPTTGQVSICDILASSPMDRLQLRGKLGICHQIVSFATGLTLEQNIRLTVASCGFTWDECKAEVENMLRILALHKKRGCTMGKLSAGQQRKVAVAVALLGNPRVLFLDEPTSGLDPESRRRMWKLLQSYKLGRAIIMSTQFMDEADTLADRKIFLSGGSILCAGSSLFLKSAMDCGFVFDVTLKAEKHGKLLENQIVSEFKTVRAKRRFRNSLSLHLPAKDIDFLPALAQALERRMELIAAFGLLQASLYDIFMRLRDLGPDGVEKLFAEGSIDSTVLNEESPEAVVVAPNEPRCSMVRYTMEPGDDKQLEPSLLRQLRAMVIMNVTRLVRTRLKLACRVFVPAFLLVGLIVTAGVERSNANHQLHLRSNMTNNGSSFDRGVCVYQEVPGEPDIRWKIGSPQCGSLIRGVGIMDPGNSRKRFLALKKSPGTSLADFLQTKKNLEAIEKICKSKTDEAEPCPIVYTTHWGDHTPNSERTIYVGSYSIYERFNSSSAASVSMGVFQRATAYFTRTKRKETKSKVGSNGFFFRSSGVYDYRSTFVPTLGAFFQMLILAFMPATFLDDIIEDKESRVRYQLMSIGMDSLNYWLTNSVIHWLQYAIVYSLSTFLLLAIVQTGYSSTYYMAGVYLPTLLFGLTSNQLMVYVLSSLLDRVNHLVTIMYFFFSIFLALIILAVQLNNVVSIILIALLPPYATISLTFYGAKTVFYTLSFYKKDSLSKIEGIGENFYFSQPHVLAAFAAMILHSVVMLALLVLIENRVMLMQRLENYFTSPSAGHEEWETSDDPGVQEEMERVNENPRNDEKIMEVRHLRKTYPNGAKIVRDISFATGPAEVFGLLGPSGAGKTTALSMMVGQLKASGGRCEVRYKDDWLPSGVAASKGAIGYCPQFDPLYSCISVTEHLQFYASIMGVPSDVMQGQIAALVETLGLDTADEKMVGQLSLGNRRRLSLAMSLLGEPAVLVIDEATSGVDPEGKRYLWQAIRTAATMSCSVIVTTHSMEEVEAICNRVAVLNRGLMVGLGTVQELRTQYGRTYSLEILIRTSIGEDPEELESKKRAMVASVTGKFEKAIILEEFNDRVHFSIPVTSISRLSSALSWLVDNKNQLSIHYFSLYQTSMDQVFERMVKLHEKLMKSQRRGSMFSVLSSKSS